MPILTKTTPPAEYLHQLFIYQPETGLLVNKIDRKGGVKAGEVAGCINQGYRNVKIDGTAYRAHRIVWKMAYNEDPADDIHHGKGGPLDNRLENLSVLTHRENCSIERTEASGLPVGVRRDKGRYKAQITIAGKPTHLGNYDTPEAASAAYQKALAMHLDGFSPEEIRQALGVAQKSSQYKGVCWRKQNQKWVAQITIDGKNKHLGLFPTEEAAHQAYLQHKN